MSPDDFRAFSRVLPDAYLLVSGSGEIMAANPAAEELFGGDLRECEGRSLFDLVSDEQGKLREYIAAAARTSGPVPGALMVRSPDGSDRPCICLGGVVLPAGTGHSAQILLRLEPRASATNRFRLLSDQVEQLSREVRRRRQAERENERHLEAERQARAALERGTAELQATTATLRAVTESSPLAIVGLDLAGHINLWNPAAEHLFGWTAAEVVGGPLPMVPAEGRDQHLRWREQASRGESPLRVEARRLRKDGSLVDVELSVATLRDGDSVHGLVGLFVDISERKRAEAQLKRAKEAAEASSRAKSDFMATVSHELRTPLSAIIGYSELLQDGIPEPIGSGARKQVERIGLGARHLQQLIEEILTFSRLEAGRERVDVQPVSLHELLEEVHAVIEPLAAKAGLRFTVRAAPSPEPVWSDPRKLRQILLNLLGNAIKFTKEGVVRLEVEAGEDEICFRVSDTGIGIDPRTRDRLFEPFWQADGSRTREAGGTGLGLSISQRLSELLGGGISAEGEPGCGSTFTLRLPSRAPVSQPA